MLENEKLEDAKANAELKVEVNEFNPYLGEIFDCEARVISMKQGHC